MTKDQKIALLKEENNKMFEFVRYVATDYIELSHEKVRIQRDDYVRMARDIMRSLNEEKFWEVIT